MEKKWRIIIDEPNNGSYNMAKDEALCRIYESDRVPTLRLYSWLRPAISMGYRQDPDDLINRYRRAAMYLFADEYQEALAELLAILERDAGFRDGAARRAMTAVFELLGNEHPLTERYRVLMKGVLF